MNRLRRRRNWTQSRRLLDGYLFVLWWKSSCSTTIGFIQRIHEELDSGDCYRKSTRNCHSRVTAYSRSSWREIGKKTISNIWCQLLCSRFPKNSQDMKFSWVKSTLRRFRVLLNRIRSLELFSQMNVDYVIWRKFDFNQSR